MAVEQEGAIKSTEVEIPKSIRNPAAIRDTRKWNPIVVEQEVVIEQP